MGRESRRGLVASSDIEWSRRSSRPSPRATSSALWPSLDPDVVFIAVTGEHRSGGPSPIAGHEGMREYFRDVARVWEELRLTPQ